MPAIADVVFTGGGHVSTIENLFHFLRQLAAIIWLGGIPAVNVPQEWIGGGNDRAAQASLLRQSDLYGRAVIAPAAAVTENPITDTLNACYRARCGTTTNLDWCGRRLGWRDDGVMPRRRSGTSE